MFSNFLCLFFFITTEVEGGKGINRYQSRMNWSYHQNQNQSWIQQASW